MESRFEFERSEIEKMHLTVSFRASVKEWRELREQLAAYRGNYTPAGCLDRAIRQIMDRITDTTSRPYETTRYGVQAEPVESAEAADA